MAARATGSATISFGLVSIPVKLYTAASSETGRFNMIDPETGSRVRQQLYNPVTDQVVDRNALAKGFEYAKNQYVIFTDDELKSLEGERSQTIDIVEFVPLSTVDLVYVDRSFYLGPDKGGAKAYKLLSEAMGDTGKVAVGRYHARGREQLVLVRPYQDGGIILHQVYYADEVRSFDDVDLGEPGQIRSGEKELAEQLIDQLSVDAFDPEKFRDTYRDRVLQAVEQKVAGEEVTVAAEQPQAQIIDLFEALKASLGEDAGGPAGGPKKASSGSSSSESRGKGSSGRSRKKKKAAGAEDDDEAEGDRAAGKKGGRGMKPPRKATATGGGKRSSASSSSSSSRSPRKKASGDG